ncbi:hypothetical protein HDV05_007583 [Chytridiales sp. JEL 0842]|nr:hypothetical protein HDV05_007583 [Chytridiales sp. JEL 0842]
MCIMTISSLAYLVFMLASPVPDFGQHPSFMYITKWTLGFAITFGGLVTIFMSLLAVEARRKIEPLKQSKPGETSCDTEHQSREGFQSSEEAQTKTNPAEPIIGSRRWHSTIKPFMIATIHLWFPILWAIEIIIAFPINAYAVYYSGIQIGFMAKTFDPFLDALYVFAYCVFVFLGSTTMQSSVLLAMAFFFSQIFALFFAGIPWLSLVTPAIVFMTSVVGGCFVARGLLTNLLKEFLLEMAAEVFSADSDNTEKDKDLDRAESVNFDSEGSLPAPQTAIVNEHGRNPPTARRKSTVRSIKWSRRMSVQNQIDEAFSAVAGSPAEQYQAKIKRHAPLGSLSELHEPKVTFPTSHTDLQVETTYVNTNKSSTDNAPISINTVQTQRTSKTFDKIIAFLRRAFSPIMYPSIQFRDPAIEKVYCTWRHRRLMVRYRVMSIVMSINFIVQALIDTRTFCDPSLPQKSTTVCPGTPAFATVLGLRIGGIGGVGLVMSLISFHPYFGVASGIRRVQRWIVLQTVIQMVSTQVVMFITSNIAVLDVTVVVAQSVLLNLLFCASNVFLDRHYNLLILFLAFASTVHLVHQPLQPQPRVLIYL